MQIKYLSAAVLAAGSMFAAQTKRVDVIDPVLNLKAYSYSVPADWTFDGAVMPGSSCVNVSTPYWRATSPDGLTGVKLLPRMDWSWASRPIPGPAKADCLPLKQVIKARDLIAYMLPILGVQLLRETDEPEAAGFQRQMQETTRQQRPTVWTGDRARVVVKYEIKGHPVEELVVGLVMCSDTPVAYVQPPLHTYSCSGSIWRSHAPSGRLDTATELLNSITGSYSGNPEWSQRWNAVMSKQISDTYARQTVEVARARRASGPHSGPAPQSFRSGAGGAQSAAPGFYEQHAARRRSSQHAISGSAIRQAPDCGGLVRLRSGLHPQLGRSGASRKLHEPADRALA